MRNGKTETNDISMFVKEIDPKYLENPVFAAAASFGSFYGKSSPARPYTGYRASSSRVENEYDRSRAGQRPVRPTSVPGFGQRPSAALPAADPNFKADDMNVFRVGQRVEHNRFGAGKILSLSGVAPEIRAEVEFDAYGSKILLLKYAKMRIARG